MRELGSTCVVSGSTQICNRGLFEWLYIWPPPLYQWRRSKHQSSLLVALGRPLRISTWGVYRLALYVDCLSKNRYGKQKTIRNRAVLRLRYFVCAEYYQSAGKRVKLKNIYF